MITGIDTLLGRDPTRRKPTTGDTVLHRGGVLPPGPMPTGGPIGGAPMPTGDPLMPGSPPPNPRDRPLPPPGQRPLPPPTTGPTFAPPGGPAPGPLHEEGPGFLPPTTDPRGPEIGDANPNAPRPPSIPAPSAGPAMPTFGGGTGGAWGALRQRIVMPETRPDVQALRDLITGGATELFNGPDRSAIAREQMELYNQDAQEMLDQRVRGIGRDAAAFGRIGSGVTTSRVGDAYAQAEQERAEQERRMALETAGLTLDDRLRAVSGASGVQNMFYGQDVGNRNEIRGERSYANDLAQQEYQRRIQQIMLEMGILRNDQGVAQGVGRDAGSYGFGY